MSTASPAGPRAFRAAFAACGTPPARRPCLRAPRPLRAAPPAVATGSSCASSAAAGSDADADATRRASSRGAGSGSGSSGGESRYWRWRSFDVHYEVHRATGGAGAPAEASADVVFLAGFGCGSFHFANNLAPLSRAGGVDCWAMDIAGQGSSWPVDEVALDALKREGHAYDARLWVEQLKEFVRHVVRARGETGGVKRPLYLVGNSLGGYLSAAAAAELAKEAPGAVSGVALLNATPFWGSTAVFPYKGALPVPPLLLRLISAYWSYFSSEVNIKFLLNQVYARHEPLDEDPQLIAAIRAPTRHSHALEAFCSILTSPALRPDEHLTAALDGALDELHARGVRVAMFNGAQDPWVVPAWGRRAKRREPQTTLVELSPAGHCPHHEAPHAANALLAEFVRGGDPAAAEVLAEAQRAEGDARAARHLPQQGAFSVVAVEDGEPTTALGRFVAQAERSEAEWLKALKIVVS